MNCLRSQQHQLSACTSKQEEFLRKSIFSLIVPAVPNKLSSLMYFTHSENLGRDRKLMTSEDLNEIRNEIELQLTYYKL